MYIKLDKNQQKDLINKAIKKAGSYRNLAETLKIPKASICNYKSETIPKNRFDLIVNFLEIKNPERLIIKKLNDNWKQVIGGKNCVKRKKEKNIFNKQLKKAQKKGALKLKEWHKSMKENNPEKYYLIQYSRFKKIGKYKYKTKRGELVRNLLEKQTADFLYGKGINYQYEPLIKADNKYFFPDFVLNGNIIIECTMWRGEIKAYKLKEKIRHLEKEYKVFVLIPKSLYKYYKILNNHLIFELEDNVPVAQTFQA